MLKKITSLFLTGALMLGAAATAEGVSGTFSGEGTGYGGTIAVDVTLENGAITGIDVTGSNETQGIGTVAIDKRRGHGLRWNDCRRCDARSAAA